MIECLGVVEWTLVTENVVAEVRVVVLTENEEEGIVDPAETMKKAAAVVNAVCQNWMRSLHH